jgi:hypothetical protein
MITDFQRDAIYALYPQVTMLEDNGTAWSGGSADSPDFVLVEYSEADVNAKAQELEAAYNAKQYQRERQYPSIQEQLDMQYWDSVNGTTTWADAIAAVKAANPKPE